MTGEQTPRGRPSRPDPRSSASGPHAADLARVFAAVRTARLSLRRPDMGDGPAMFRVHGDSATNRYNPAGPDQDLATSEEVLRDWIEHWEEDGYGYWAVAMPPAAEVVGFGGVRRIRWRDREVLNQYYRLTPTVLGYGYASELAKTAVDLARAHLPHLPIVARTRPENTASTRVAERSGLARRHDLDTDEHLVFALGWPPRENEPQRTRRTQTAEEEGD